MLSDTIQSWQMQRYLAIDSQLSMECNDCVWEEICGGGRHIQRFSKEDGFKRKSVFCPSLRKIMSRIASYLIESGISEELIMNNLKDREQ